MEKNVEKENALIQIGLKIRELRKEKNMSIQYLSDQLNIEYNNLIRIEKGRTNFTIGTLLKVAKALDTTLHELLTNI